MSAAVQPSNLVGPGKRMKRRPELDALRGLMLVWMTLTHLPTIASVFTNQPLGFVSASEGFIFLSALFTGSVYYGLAQREGDAAMYCKLALRTLRLYGY
ncbi:MAG TPA: OpgC domain-containing protein, partial [Bryobacteraceae bacterium]|nr:OpgC domain-containing protein [Bryobacteraceae bacterium]